MHSTPRQSGLWARLLGGWRSRFAFTMSVRTSLLALCLVTGASCEDGLFLETDSYIFNPNSRVSFTLHSDPDDSLAARERIADVSIVGPGNTAILLDVVQQLDQNHLA